MRIKPDWSFRVCFSRVPVVMVGSAREIILTTTESPIRLQAIWYPGQPNVRVTIAIDYVALRVCVPARQKVQHVLNHIVSPDPSTIKWVEIEE